MFEKLLKNWFKKNITTGFNWVSLPTDILSTLKIKASLSLTLPFDNLVANFALVSKKKNLPETFNV